MQGRRIVAVVADRTAMDRVKDPEALRAILTKAGVRDDDLLTVHLVGAKGYRLVPPTPGHEMVLRHLPPVSDPGPMQSADLARVADDLRDAGVMLEADGFGLRVHLVTLGAAWRDRLDAHLKDRDVERVPDVAQRITGRGRAFVGAVATVGLIVAAVWAVPGIGLAALYERGVFDLGGGVPLVVVGVAALLAGLLTMAVGWPTDKGKEDVALIAITAVISTVLGLVVCYLPPATVLGVETLFGALAGVDAHHGRWTPFGWGFFGMVVTGVVLLVAGVVQLRRGEPSLRYFFFSVLLAGFPVIVLVP